MKQPSQMPEAAALSGLCPYAEFAVVSEGTCAGTQAGAEGGKSHLRERALALALVAAAAVGPAGSSVDVGWVDEVLGHRHFQALVDHVAQLRRHTQQSHTQQPHTRDGPKRPTPSSAPVWSPTQKRARDDAKAERSHGRGTVGLHAGLLEANEAVKHATFEKTRIDSCIQAMKGMVKSTKAGEREWMAKWAVPPGHYGGACRFLRGELEERLDFSLEELEDVPQGAAVSNRQTNSSIKEKVEASNCLQSLANCQLADHYWIFKLLGKRRSDLEELRKHFLMIEAIGASRCTAHGREGLGATEHVSFTTKLQEGSSSVPMRFVSP